MKRGAIGKLLPLCLALVTFSNGWAEYKSPAWDTIPYDPAHTTLSPPERSQLADAMADYARSLTEGDATTLDTLRAKAIALALRLDSENKSAVILNAKFKRGEAVQAKGPSIPKEALSRMLIMQAKRLQSPNSPGQDAVLAAYVLDFLASIDSTNEELLYQAEMAARKTPVNWNNVLAGSGSATASSKSGSTSSTSEKKTTTTSSDTPPVNLKQTQSKVNGLVVISSDDSTIGGKVLEIIATANLSPGDDSTCEFATTVGDDMKIAKDEAFRAVQVRHPEVKKGVKFVLSFDDKYTPKAGGSAGTAFAVGISSILDGFQLDSKTAMTGDITVDGKVRKVGGVPTKIRGAKLDGCKLVGIPNENESDVANLMVLNGYRAIAEIQIFSINTLDDAVGLARSDRSDNLQEAVKTFAEVQQALDGSGALGDQVPKLEKVLSLAPNHLSAKYLLEKNRGTAPTMLTASAAVEELFDAASPLLLFFRSLDKEERQRYRNSQILVFTFPPATYSGMRERLTQLEKKMPPQIQNTYYAMVNLLDRVEYFDGQYKGVPHRSSISSYNSNFPNDVPRRTRLDDIVKQYQLLVGELTKLDYDKQFLEAQIH